MSTATQFYISTLMVYFAVDILAAWGLSLQFGMVGLLSFSFIVFQAAGAYTAAVLSLGPDTVTVAFSNTSPARACRSRFLCWQRARSRRRSRCRSA